MYQLTKENLENLKEARDMLDAIKDDPDIVFVMGDTKHCVVGHYAKFKKTDITGAFNLFFEEPDLSSSDLEELEHTLIVEYLTAYDWKNIDNTIQGAIDRLDYVIDHKTVPGDFEGF